MKREATGGGKYAANRKSRPMDRNFKNKHKVISCSIGLETFDMD